MEELLSHGRSASCEARSAGGVHGARGTAAACRAAGWVMGFIGSVLGIYASYSYDMPTGAAVVATFGVLLVIALIVRALIPGEAHSVMGKGHA